MCRSSPENPCTDSSCDYWVLCPEIENCVLCCSPDRTFTMREVGKILHCSHQRIYELEKSALKKLKNGFGRGNESDDFIIKFLREAIQHRIKLEARFEFGTRAGIAPKNHQAIAAEHRKW